MSLIKQQINYEKEIKKKEIYFNLIKLTNQKMILPNDECFTSFHDKLFDNNDNQLRSKNDCSRSYDFSNFKNKNLITLNNSLFINDPLNDSLQWCLEGGYQSEPKNIYENELNNTDLLTNSSINSKLSIDPQQNSFNESKFSFHSNQNYNQMSKNLDETLAQMDIETFSRLDMNNLLNGINNKFSSTEEQVNQSIEINNYSVNDSLISEIIEHSNEFKERFNNSSYTINSNKLDEISSIVNNDSNLTNNEILNDELNNTTINLESVGISVDSLDNSCFEQKCAEVVNKCKINNKNKYKLTFEQLDDSITESLLNYFQNDLHNVQTEEEKQKTYEHYLQRLKNNEIYLNKLFNDLNRRIKLDKLSKSEYNNDDYKQSSQFKNSLSNDLNNQTINLTRSLQNNLVNCDDYVPLFNLNNSFNNSNNSSPKEIINLLNNQLNDSNNNNNLNSNNSSTKTTKTLILKKTNDQQSLNENNIKQQQFDKLNTIENQLTTFRNTNDSKQQKIYFNTQTSPIREDDERDHLMSNKKEIKKYTNFQNVTATMARNQFNTTNKLIDQEDNDDDDDYFNENTFNREKSNCPRSISMNEFNSNKRPNLIKQYSLKTTGQQTINSQQQQQTKANYSRINRNSKECSLSSGYLSSGGSNNLFIAANFGDNRKNIQLNNNKIPLQQQQLFNQQYACVEDKQVQTSTIYNNNEQHQFSNQHYLPPHLQQTQTQTQPILINELPKNCCQNSTHNSPIYVYYPNYSLPDLNFVNNSMIPLQNLHLSPTKFQPPNLDNSNFSIRRSSANKINLRYNNSKIRPKSCGDFEKLTKEKFKHIQDWESLKTLLPDDIRDLIIRTLNSEDENLEEDNEINNYSKIMKSKTTSNTPTSHKTFQMATNYNNQSSINSRKDSNTDSSGIRLRQNSKINRGYCMDKNQSNSTSNKRFSLQEPINDCMLDCSSTNNSESFSNSSNRRCGMIKSATMNMPIQIQQHQKQFLYEQQQRQFQMSRICYQNLCHSCCNMSMCYHRQQQLMNMGSCCSSCHCGSSNHLNQQQLNNYCNNQCNHHVNNHLEHYQQQHYQQQNQFNKFNNCQSTMTSPLKPFNSIIQEENDFESLNCLLENENENGELDFDKLLNCNREISKNKIIKLNDKNQLKKKVTTNLKSKQLNNTSNGNFSQLKNHWEQVSSSKTVSSSKSTPTTPVTPITQQSKKSITNQQTKRPTTSNTVTTRRNQVKSKIVNSNQRRSRSKSPEKSNKEVIILTTKKKPSLPIKPSNTLIRATKDLSKDKQINKTTNSNQTTVASKKPIRPNNFNGQPFKSMIPRPTTINRSPPLK